jgi:hypothetical protein
VAQTISRLFSLWFTIVRKVRDMTVRGGVSLGAVASVSEKGLMSFGSATEASNLHQDTYGSRVLKCKLRYKKT